MLVSFAGILDLRTRGIALKYPIKSQVQNGMRKVG
jgi:hypothetical protein